MMTEEQLKARTKAFALRVMKVARTLSNNLVDRAVAGQIIRSGMSVAANYRAASRGRSKAEFLSKPGIVEEEADETLLWLELIIEGGILPAKRVTALRQEAHEIVAIISASRRTARRVS